jgi:hypothetical protein
MIYIKDREKMYEMSSYHRGIAEDFEKKLTSYINNRNVNAQANVKLVGDYIIQCFPDIVEAQHIGSKSYNVEGDILLVTESKPINLEIKTSDSFGKGTLANSSQKLFTAIDPNILGYQDFHNNFIYKNMRFKDYCWKIVGDKVGKKIRTASEYATILRTLRDSGSEVVDEIVDTTNDIKLEYNSYLIKELKKTPDYLYKLTYLVRLLKDGIHTFSDIRKELAEFKGIESYKKRSEYYVVYIYNVSSDVSCEIADYSKAIDTVYSIDFVGQSIVLKNIDNDIILRFSTHWKNLCQGGATPCFNIFHYK